MSAPFKINGPGRYRTRVGLVATVDTKREGIPDATRYPWAGTVHFSIDSMPVTWRDDGRYLYRCEHSYDLVEKLPDEA